MERNAAPHPRRARHLAAVEAHPRGASTASPSAASSPRGRAAAGRRLRLPAPALSAACNTSTTPRPTTCRQARRPGDHRPRHGLRELRSPVSELDTHREIVGKHSTASSATPPRPRPRRAVVCAADEERSADEFRRLGYPDAAAARPPPRHRQERQPATGKCRRASGWLRPADPAGGGEASQTADPNATFERLLDLLDAISRRGSYLALLQQYPADRAQGGRAGGRLRLGRPVPQPPSHPPRRSPRPAHPEEELDLPAFRAPSFAQQLDEIEPTWNARWT